MLLSPLTDTHDIVLHFVKIIIILLDRITWRKNVHFATNVVSDPFTIQLYYYIYTMCI